MLFIPVQRDIFAKWLLEQYHNLEKVGEILMSLFIRNMNMPRINRLYKCELDVRPSGTVLKVNNPITGKEERYVVQEIATPHGRLIDADNVSSDAMCSHCVEEYCRNNCECFIENIQTILSNELITPTIIEAEIAYE